MLTGKRCDTSDAPGKVLAPYPKIGTNNSVEKMSWQIISINSRYWLGLEIFEVWTERPLL